MKLAWSRSSRQLREQRVVELRQDLRQAVAEMRRHAGPRARPPSAIGRKIGCGMADRDDLAGLAHGADEALRCRAVRARSVTRRIGRDKPLRARDEGRVRRDHRLRRMASRIAVRRVEERPFEVIARHHQARPSRLRATAASSAANRAASSSAGRRDQGRQTGGHARGEASPREHCRAPSASMRAALKSTPAKPFT